MLVRLGPRTAAKDLVDALADCHGRIRQFVAMAARLADSSGSPDDDIRGVAGQIRRYFAEAFPLHVADEEEDIVPRLHGQDAGIDVVLASMQADHAAHEPEITRLVLVCEAIEHDPRQLAAHTDELTAIAGRLGRVLEAHLVLEEREIFPALRALAPEIRDEIHAAMRRRRATMQ